VIGIFFIGSFESDFYLFPLLENTALSLSFGALDTVRAIPKLAEIYVILICILYKSVCTDLNYVYVAR
jgi:hypothetical protein